MTKLELDIEDIQRARILLKSAGGNIYRVMGSALKRTGQMIRTRQTRLIRQGYNIPANIVNKRIKLRVNEYEGLEAIVLNATNRIPLESFKVNKQNPGHYKEKIRVSVKKGSVKTLNGGFWAFFKSKPNNLGLYNRAGTGRDTLEKLYGPSVFQMGVTPRIISDLQNEAIEIFSKRVEHEFLRELGIK